MAAGRHHIDERLTGVALLEQSLKIDRGIGHACIQGRMDTTNHRRQMRDESQADVTARSLAQALTNFRQMAVALDRVGLHALASLAEQRTDAGTAACAADTA